MRDELSSILLGGHEIATMLSLLNLGGWLMLTGFSREPVVSFAKIRQG